MRARVLDRIARCLFIVAAVLCLLVNPLPYAEIPRGTETPTYGWELWDHVASSIIRVEDMSLESKGPAFGWVLGTVVVLVSPFIVSYLATNRLLWWCLAVASMLTVFGLTGVLGWMTVAFEPGGGYVRFRIGWLLLLAFPVVHFIGLLFVRQRTPE